MSLIEQQLQTDCTSNLVLMRSFSVAARETELGNASKCSAKLACCCLHLNLKYVVIDGLNSYTKQNYNVFITYIRCVRDRNIPHNVCEYFE